MSGKVAVDRDALIRLAVEARDGAYAPYSRFAVGAALLASSGKVYAACNVENAVYNLGICAERVAVFTAVCAGEREFVAIAVVSGPGVTPCGACRQVLREFGPELQVIVADAEGIARDYDLGELLPDDFSAVDLPS